jgi:hypothetical protein
MTAPRGREPFRLSEDAEGRVYLASRWQPKAVAAVLVGLLSVFAVASAVRGGPFLRTYGVLALAAVLVEAGLIFDVVRARGRRIVFDASRAEVALREGASTRRSIPFAQVRGIRIVPLGRGFQWSVQLVTASDERIELMATGVIETAKALAAGLSSRFGFAAMAE